MSSPDRPEETELEDAGRLEAEADYAAEHNPPSGTDAGPTAADEGAAEIKAPGAPDTSESTASTVAESGSAAPPSAEPDAPTTGGVQPETPAAEMLAGTRPIPKPAPKPAPDAAAPEQPAPAAAPTPSVADEPVEVAPGGDGVSTEVPSAEVHAEPSQTEVPAPEVEAPTEAEPVAPAAEEPAATEAVAEAEPEAPTAEEPAAEPEPEPEPEPVFDEKRSPMLEALQASLGDAVVETAIILGPDAVARVRPDAWRQAIEVCRDQLGLTYFCFLSGMDWMPSPYGKSEESGLRRAEDIPDAANGPFPTGAAGGETRFQVFARLEKPTADLGLTLKADVPDDLTMDTVFDLFAGAEWHEREVAEMYGIDFRGHPNPTHIYLPGEFEGFPLRKDYPLLAREVKPWPGLVDVEPMPGEDVEPAEGEATEEVTAS